MIVAAGVGGVGEVALEGELFHDGVADELPVEVDLGAEAGSADVEEDAFAAHVGGDVDGAVPPGDAEVGAVLGDGVVGGVAVLLGRVGALTGWFAEAWPQRCCSTVLGRVTGRLFAESGVRTCQPPVGALIGSELPSAVGPFGPWMICSGR